MLYAADRISYEERLRCASCGAEFDEDDVAEGDECPECHMGTVRWQTVENWQYGEGL